MVFPLEAVLRVADLEAFKMNLTDEALPAVGVAGAEDKLRPVRLIETAFDQPFAPEQGKSGGRCAGNLSQGGKAGRLQANAEIEAEFAYTIAAELSVGVL